jgi:ubiquinone/menaquinone biosynthesis C-methylase UbiE
MTAGFPDLDRLAFERYNTGQTAKHDDSPRVERVMKLLNRLKPMAGGQSVCVVGCGPVPQPVRILQAKGHRAVGVEPVRSFVERAQEYLGDGGSVLLGAAEAIPLPSGSQDLVLFENVLEHVDSVPASLAEIERVLKPGGMLYLVTNNRLKFYVTGWNPEFRLRFYNWYPALVRESYVFEHLHYRPHLANFTQRPAVHWYSFAELCTAGRSAGFAQFYSPLDLLRTEDFTSSPSRGKRILGRLKLLNLLQQNAWFRSLALTQLPNEVIMIKRPAE